MTVQHFVTGATGFLGRHLVRRLLRRGDRVVALVRAGSESAGRERLLRVLGDGYERTALRVVAGDLVDGVPPGVDAAYDHVWHLAALLDLGENRREELHAANTAGTLALLDHFREAGVGRFHHVSTAYVCGISRDPVPEGPIRPPVVHRNRYEETKHAAESHVRDAMVRGLRATILRPSIVVGDATLGHAEVFGAFYAVVRACVAARDLGGLVLPGRPDALLDLVPVDRVVAALVRLADDERAVGGTFHLTNPQPPTLLDVALAANAALGLSIVSVGDLEPRRSPSSAEAVARAVAPMLPYLRARIRFERAAGDALLGSDFLAPAVDTRTWLQRLMLHARDADFGVGPTMLERERRVLRRLAVAPMARRGVAV